MEADARERKKCDDGELRPPVGLGSSPALFMLLFACFEKPPCDFGTGIFVLVAPELVRLHVPVELKWIKEGGYDRSRDDRKNNPDKHDV